MFKLKRSSKLHMKLEKTNKYTGGKDFKIISYTMYNDWMLSTVYEGETYEDLTKDGWLSLWVKEGFYNG